MIFDLGQELAGRLQTISEQVTIRIGVTPYVPKAIIDMFLHYILTTVPGVHFSLREDKLDKLTQDLSDHLLDIILTDAPFDANALRDITSHLIGRIPIVFCVNPRLARKVKKFPEDLKKIPLILPAAPTQIYYTVREYLDENRIEPDIIGEIEDIEIVRRLVLRGHGAAPLNLLTIQGAPARRKLVVLNTEPEEKLCEKIYLVTKKRKIPHPLLDTILKNFLIEDFMKDFDQCK